MTASILNKAAMAVLIVGLLTGLGGRAAWAVPIYSAGHGDIGSEYDADEDPNAFFVHLHAHAGTIVDGAPLPDDEEYAGDEVCVLVPASTNIGRTAGTLGGSFEDYDFTTAAFDYLGTGVGDDLFVLMFDSADASYYGGPFLGLAAEEGFVPSQWSGSIVYRLTGFSGPGNLSLFTAAGSRRWDTQDGSFANDAVNIGPGGHGHFYWAFTEPGDYEVTVSVSGTHTTHGLVTGSDTFKFSVVPEPASLSLLGTGALGLLGLAWRRRRAQAC